MKEMESKTYVVDPEHGGRASLWLGPKKGGQRVLVAADEQLELSAADAAQLRADGVKLIERPRAAVRRGPTDVPAPGKPDQFEPSVASEAVGESGVGIPGAGGLSAADIALARSLGNEPAAQPTAATKPPRSPKAPKAPKTPKPAKKGG